jgi:bifunctional non-homologous end joining protein LigD
MLATSAEKLPAGEDWTYEVNWDGYRTLVFKQGPRVTLFSRNLKDATSQYPSVARSVQTITVDTVLLDGEIVALD